MYIIYFAVLFLPIWYSVSKGAKYSGRFDNLDIDEVLRSDRLLKNYFGCLMERGPCTPEGSDLKRTIPDALKTECSKCSETQRSKASKAIQFLMDNKPEMYKELQGKYDPEGIYNKKISERLKLKENS